MTSNDRKQYSAYCRNNSNVNDMMPVIRNDEKQWCVGKWQQSMIILLIKPINDSNVRWQWYWHYY